MPFVPAKCTQCGANLAVDNEKDAAICQFCGTPFITEKAIQNFNITYNTTNVQNTNYNIEGSEIHIHREYDDAQTLLDNIKGLLTRQYAVSSEPVQKNFAMLEEKFPTDYRTDEVKWLLKKDEQALMRVREYDKDFFYAHANEIVTQHYIMSFREFDIDLFDRNRHKITDERLMYKLKDEYNDIAARYQVLVDTANETAKSIFFINFVGDMHQLKKSACELVKYIEQHKNEVYDYRTTGLYEKMVDYAKVRMPFLRDVDSEEMFDEDKEFMQHLTVWFEQCYSKYAQTKDSAVKNSDLDELIPKLKAKWGTKEYSVISVVNYWDSFFKVWRGGNVRETYEYLEQTKNQKGVPMYVAQFQSENFKKGIFGIKLIIKDPINDPLGFHQINREKLIEESLKYGVN